MSGVNSKANRDGRLAASSTTAALRPLAADRQALHLVNRITLGPRPGDVDRVRAIGVQAFLDEQLHPERLSDSAVEMRLRALPTLSMSTSELIERYPQPKPAGTDGTSAGKRAPEAMRIEGGEPMPEASATSVMAPAMTVGQAGDTPREVLLELGREQLLRAVYSQRQLQEVMVQFWMNHFNVFAGKGADKWMLTAFERDTIRPHALGRFEDLLVATAKSPAMLFYLDNWLSAGPNSSAESRRTAFAGGFRPFGRFGGNEAANPAAAGKAFTKRGLNENYGRELMELHTLGVSGGYTQQDVIEVARCLTGWTIRRPRLEAEFSFNPRLHDDGRKTVLGHRISGGGMEDGLEVLHLLATHPSTARFISLKLCRRFVSDDPPATVVDRASERFLGTRGDLRAVLGTILTSPEFYSDGAYRAKMKSPFEMVASTLRAFDAETDASPALLGLIGRMGEPFFAYQSPDGFPDRANAWISSSALLGRLNFATLVASNRIKGTEIALDGSSSGAGSASTDSAGLIDKLDSQLMGGALTATSRSAILKSLKNDAGTTRQGEAAPVDSRGLYPELTTAAALVIGSPEFQWR